MLDLPSAVGADPVVVPGFGSELSDGGLAGWSTVVGRCVGHGVVEVHGAGDPGAQQDQLLAAEQPAPRAVLQHPVQVGPVRRGLEDTDLGPVGLGSVRAA